MKGPSVTSRWQQTLSCEMMNETAEDEEEFMMRMREASIVALSNQFKLELERIWSLVSLLRSASTFLPLPFL